MIDKPTPLPAALRYLRQQGLMPTTGTSTDLQRMDADITERAFFAATIDRADILQQAKNLTERMVNPDADGPGQKITKTAFRRDMRRLLKDIGYVADPDGGLKDITSTKRLNLIAEMNTQEAQGYGQFEQANRPAVLNAFPAQELFRLQQRKKPRAWLRKWVDAGGHAGRMIAMKDDPIWTKRLEAGGFNRFGRPWPPYDFNSGMWIKPVSRATAVKLGVCEKADTPKRQKRTYNANLQQSCEPLSDALKIRLENQFANRYRIDESGAVHFLSVSQGIQQALKGFTRKRPTSGDVFISHTPASVQAIAENKFGQTLKNNSTIYGDASQLDHLIDRHGPDSADPDPITTDDLDSLPAMLRSKEIIETPASKKSDHTRCAVIIDGAMKLVLEKRKGNLAIITLFKLTNPQ